MITRICVRVFLQNQFTMKSKKRHSLLKYKYKTNYNITKFYSYKYKY